MSGGAGGPLASPRMERNRFLSILGALPHDSRDPVRCCRSSAIRMPRHSITVITADPPNDTIGSGIPTTGAMPITIIRLIAT